MTQAADAKRLRWARLPECDDPPDGWSVVPFRQVADVIAGQSPPSETYNDRAEGLPFLQGNGDFTRVYPAPRLWCSSPAKLAEPGDTLISVRAPVGEVNRADQRYAIGRGLAALRATDACTPDYLYQAIQRWRWSLQRVAQGTTFDAVTARHFAALWVLIPVDPEEQQAITSLLRSIDEVLDKIRLARQAAADAKRALIQHLLLRGLSGAQRKKTDIGLVPASWEVVPLRAVVSTFQYGLSVPMDTAGALPILRMGNIQDGDVELDDLKYVTLPEDVVGPYRLQQGDVLFNRTNSQEWVGKVGIYRQTAPAVFASYLIRLVYDADQVDPYYLGHVLNSYQAQCRIKRYATPGVQQVNINATNLGKVLIPLPSGSQGLTEQREIAATLEAAHACGSRYLAMESAYLALKRAVMADTLSGRVRVLETTRAGAFG